MVSFNLGPSTLYTSKVSQDGGLAYPAVLLSSSEVCYYVYRFL